MRYLIVIGALLLVLAGCVSPPSVPEEQQEQNNSEQTENCHTVSVSEPFTEEECGNVSFTDQVCELRKLNYTVTDVPKVDLCIEDGNCVGNSLGSCPECSKAMTRCVLLIRNDEPQNSGTWTVAVNYTLGNSGFNKEPITQTIGPNESFAFDFDQIYTPGYPINSASCKMAVVAEPTIDECHEETRLEVVCQNVTEMRSVDREVCD